MKEIIKYTPEDQTTPDRYFWDGFIRCLDELANVAAGDEDYAFDIMEVLESAIYMDKEDALSCLYGYATMVTVADGQSSELKEVELFLASNEFIELDDL